MVTVGQLGHDGGRARAEVDVAVTVKENDPVQVLGSPGVCWPHVVQATRMGAASLGLKAAE